MPLLLVSLPDALGGHGGEALGVLAPEAAHTSRLRGALVVAGELLVPGKPTACANRREHVLARGGIAHGREEPAENDSVHAREDDHSEELGKGRFHKAALKLACALDLHADVEQRGALAGGKPSPEHLMAEIGVVGRAAALKTGEHARGRRAGERGEQHVLRKRGGVGHLGGKARPRADGRTEGVRDARCLERGKRLKASPLARCNKVANKHRHRLRGIRPKLDGHDRKLELLRHLKGVAQRHELAHVGLLGEPPLARLELGAHLGGVRRAKLTELDGGVVCREGRGAHLHVREPVPLEVPLARPVEQDATSCKALVQRALERKELVLSLHQELNPRQVKLLDALSELTVWVVPHNHAPGVSRLLEEPHELGLYICLLHRFATSYLIFASTSWNFA